VAFGERRLGAPGATSGLLAKLDPSGEVVWAQRFEADAADFELALGPHGELVLAGRLEQTLELGGGRLSIEDQGCAFAMKLDASGRALWGRRFGVQELCGVGCLHADPRGSVLVAGAGPWVSGAPESDGAIPRVPAVLVKLDGCGETLWSRRYAPGAVIAALSADAEARPVLALNSLGPVDFGQGVVLQASGRGSMFLARMVP
jgi:hypothetical protein